MRDELLVKPFRMSSSLGSSNIGQEANPVSPASPFWQDIVCSGSMAFSVDKLRLSICKQMLNTGCKHGVFYEVALVANLRGMVVWHCRFQVTGSSGRYRNPDKLLGLDLLPRSAHRKHGYGESDSDIAVEVRLRDGSRTKLTHLSTLFVSHSHGNTQNVGVQVGW